MMNPFSLFGIDKLGLYLIGGLVILAAIIIIPNYNQVIEKLGFETRTSLKVNNQQLKDNNANLVNINTENKKTDEILDQIQDQATKIGDSIGESNIKVETKVNTIRQQHRTNLNKAPPAKTEAEKIDQVSHNNITLIWDVYKQLQEEPV